MITKRDYILMAEWISENTSSDEEWAHIRASHIKFVCFIAAESDKLSGNQKGFDKVLFLDAIDHHDEQKEKS